jgi:hypothetical protein
MFRSLAPKSAGLPDRLGRVAGTAGGVGCPRLGQQWFESPNATGSATIPHRGASNRRTYIMRFDLQDLALRTLILIAGALAAVLLTLKGQGQALPALAVGATLGACMMARFGPSEQ